MFRCDVWSLYINECLMYWCGTWFLQVRKNWNRSRNLMVRERLWIVRECGFERTVGTVVGHLSVPVPVLIPSIVTLTRLFFCLRFDFCWPLCALCALTLFIGRREEHPACKKIQWWGVDVVICLQQGADCLHMVQLMPLHAKTPPSLASFKSKLVLPFRYRLTKVVLEKRPLNGCSGICSSSKPDLLTWVFPEKGR